MTSYYFLQSDSRQLKQFYNNYNTPTDYSYYLQLFSGYHVPIPPILWYTTGKRASAISGFASSFPAYLLSHSRILIINVTIAIATLIISKGLTFEVFLCLGWYFPGTLSSHILTSFLLLLFPQSLLSFPFPSCRCSTPKYMSASNILVTFPIPALW